MGMTEEVKLKSAFVAHNRLYQFKAMPFRFCWAPTTLEQLMEKVLAELQWHWYTLMMS